MKRRPKDLSSRRPRAEVGEVVSLHLAWSLEQIAQHGREVFYKGEIAAKIPGLDETAYGR